MTSDNVLPPDDDRNDPMVALLRATASNAAPLDEAVLARLRESSAAAFAAAASPPSPDRPRGRVMFLRLFAAIAATAAGIIAVIVSLTKPPVTPVNPKPDDSAPALAKVLDTTASSPTIRYTLTTGGEKREVMAERAGRWRDDRADGSALVSDGELVWLLDKDGKATRARGVPLPRDLFNAVLVGRTHHPVDLAKAQPRAEKRDEKDVLVYQVSVASPDGEMTVEALADPVTKTLRRMTAKAGDKAIGDLQISSITGDLPEDKFLILNSLSDDGRVGKITDTQGLVSVKPLAQGRWTPIQGDFIVMPGDWLRTDSRGGNAAQVKLLSRCALIVGPGSVVEITRPTSLKLLEGELEITAPKGTSLELVGPEDQKVVVKGTQHYFLDRQGKLRLSAREPLWLKGFKGATADESIGSLVAKVDGRDVPLSVGYHKVVVDIRDQIARTTIEESFVNHTSATLEGVFHFPLPADASISGFGMWINNELVEADVVEKQRAREIYEQIMREKRDPGLLEWAGGNIFKARVWPIFGHSEKRIKITYTQVLPLKGNKYSYSYALQSEMLQQNPLRELSLTVNVASAVPLKKVWSPTHTTRDQATEYAARVEFTAQEYTPRKDFEVVVEQNKRPSDVVLVPHRRGADGYMLLQIMPPAAAQERATLPSAGPVRLLIVADTSASMDRRQRSQQEAVIAALVSSLTPADTFNLACCDVTCDWAFEHPVAAEAKNLVLAREMLSRRVSLGWTDLEKAFASVMSEADARTHVVYVGDGIPVTTSADPIAFAQKLKTTYQKQGTFHAITTGTSYEAPVVKAIASLGGGSWRRIGAEQGPLAVALELLREITQPTLRDVKVEFRGLRTARVYPTELPNIPAGMQQILLGRYLPDGQNQQGDVIVTGTLDGKPVTMTAKVSLKDAESGNSFIPRLWARMHLDALLELGSSESIRDEVIALSEEFNIMTPYTSFLVLESDADRERFGVKKRFRMRDGEKFFAESRDKVDFALVQQQMKRAGTYRLNMRRDVMRTLASLGRDYRAIQTVAEQRDRMERMGKRLEMLESKTELYFAQDELGQLSDMSAFSRQAGGFGGGMPISGSGVDSKMNFNMPRGESLIEGAKVELSEMKKDLKDNISESVFDSREELTAADQAPGKPDVWDAEEGDGQKQYGGGKNDDVAAGLSTPGEPTSPRGPAAKGSGMFGRPGRGRGLGFDGEADVGLLVDERRAKEDAEYSGYFQLRKREYQSRDDSLYWQQQWWQTLFPLLSPSTKTVAPKPSTWPDAARVLSQSLLRRDKLRSLKSAIELQVISKSFDPRYGELSSQGVTVNLYSPKSWLWRSQHDGQQTVIHWCDGTERGLIHRAFGVGRVRPASPDDLGVPFSLSDHSLIALDESYRDHAPSIEPAGNDRVRLVMKHGDHEIRSLIDTARHLLLSVEYATRGKVSSSIVFGDFVEIAGQWWAREIETRNEKNERTSQSMLTIRELNAEQFAARSKEELAPRAQTMMVKSPLPRLDEARKVLAENKATLEDHVVLMRYFVAIQQWTKAREQLDVIEKLTDKPARRFLRDAINYLSRRFDELKQRQLAEATNLGQLGLPRNDAYALAQHLYSRSSHFMQAAELLDLLAKLEPTYKAQPAQLHAFREFRRNRMYQLNNVGRPVEGLEILKQLAREYPRDSSVQQEYAQTLASHGDYSAAMAWIDQAIAANPKWVEHEEESLRNLRVSYLTAQGNTDELLKYSETWMGRKPVSRTAYLIHLGTLVRLGQQEKADELIGQWMKAGQIRGELPPETKGRLYAALAHAMGQGYQLHTGRIEERWVAPLAEVVKFFAHDAQNGEFADFVMNYLNTGNGDPVVKLVKEMAEDLLAAAPTLAPERIDRLHRFVSGHGDQELWKKLIAVLEKRRQSEKDPVQRDVLGNSLLTILQAHRPIDEVLAFKRLRLKEGRPEQRAYFAASLFDSLLATTWKQEYEDEAFRLLSIMGEGVEKPESTRIMVERLYQLTDRMVAMRTADLNQKIDRPDKLTRIELRDKQAANLKAARGAYADRLTKELTHAPADLAPWVRIERMYFDVVLDRNIAQVAADCWEILGNEPPGPAKDEADPKSFDVLGSRLKDRAFVTLNYLATRPKADAAMIDRLLTYLDKGIAREGNDTAWKSAKHRLLVAADRPKILEADLKKWADKSPMANYWRINLGFLQAELGRLKEAVALFETVREAGELGPLAYRSLANWYMVLNEKDKHEKALLDQYRFTEEYVLSRMIQQRLYPWQRGDRHLPTELDKDVLRLFAVLFEKSAYPANYVYQLNQFYQACRDFRLLAMLADAIVGQTPMKVYPFLQNLSQIFQSIQDEAVVDELMAQLAKSRLAAKTVVDQRALDLFEVLVRRRAAELKNQAGPHGDLALAAMKRAFERAWAEHEQPLMASFLRSLGTIAYGPMADEQMREMKWLYDHQPKSSSDRLQVAVQYAFLMHGYGKAKEGIDLLRPDVDAVIAAHNGVMPSTANEAMSLLVTMYRSLKRHAEAESFLTERLAKPGNDEQRVLFLEQLDNTLLSAMSDDARTTLGVGKAIYSKLEEKLRRDCAQSNPYHQYRMVMIACQFFASSKELKIEAYRDDLMRFGMIVMPELMKFHHNYYDSIVNQISNTIRNVNGPRDALEYAIDRIEKEPAWFRFNNQDGWYRHGSSMAQWRSEIQGGIGVLEPRLLKIVLGALRRDLDTRNSANRSIYHRQSGYYWSEKDSEFAQVAEDVYEKRPGSGAHSLHIAEYFYHGLGRPARAIEILDAAYRKNLLDEDGVGVLVRYLREQRRHVEAIALLEPLVARKPANLQYRVWLMNSYFASRQPVKLMALLKTTHEFFHQENRWSEGACATLGYSCVENALWNEAAEYFKEAIPLRQRGAPNRGIGDGTLSEYYSNLSIAYGRLGKTDDAVDAGSGAIVAWPSTHHSRNTYVDRLRQVLIDAKDLDQFVVRLDAKEKESGVGTPVIRKAIARAYQSRGEFAKAVPQFRAAIELQPEDTESHDQLIACLDQQGDKEGAIAATLQFLELSRRNLELYKRLGDRMTELARHHDAERAFTSIVEMQPNEAESHTLLAQVRQTQARLTEAAGHWEQAAKQRALEPTALIELARVQLALKQWDKADATLTKLEKTAWPQRFDSERVKISQLRATWKSQKP